MDTVTTNPWAMVSVVLWCARLVAFIALHIVPSPYSAIRNAVSDYAVGPTRALSSVMTWVTAAAWASLAAAVWVGYPGWPDRTGIVTALIALAVIFVALPFVPTSLEGEKPSAIGRLHLLLAVAWFAVSYGCMGNFIRLLADRPETTLTTAIAILSWVALVGLVALVVSLLLPGLRRRTFGISERAFILAVSFFYLCVAMLMATA